MQNARVLVSFLLRAVVVGLAAAFLVVWWKPAFLGVARSPRAQRAGPPRRARRSSSELRRLGGARGARRRQRIYRARGHRAAAACAARSAVRRLLAELSPARRAQLGIGRDRRREGHHRHQPARHRRRRFDPGSARRRPHRRRAVVGQDPDTDLAILHLSIDKLPVMPMGRSDTLRVGDIVLAIGNPLRAEPDGDAGHRERHRPRPARPRDVRELHPDRCRHQSRQLGRRADRRARRPGRHQYRGPQLAPTADPRASASRSR